MASNLNNFTLRNDEVEILLQALEILKQNNLNSEDLEDVQSLQEKIGFSLYWNTGK